jgi:hypothetical protein
MHGCLLLSHMLSSHPSSMQLLMRPSTETLLGKLRLRPSALVPGRLVLHASLPLHGDRGMQRSPVVTAMLHASLRVGVASRLGCAADW